MSTADIDGFVYNWDDAMAMTNQSFIRWWRAIPEKAQEVAPISVFQRARQIDAVMIHPGATAMVDEIQGMRYPENDEQDEAVSTDQHPEYPEWARKFSPVNEPYGPACTVCGSTLPHPIHVIEWRPEVEFPEDEGADGKWAIHLDTYLQQIGDLLGHPKFSAIGYDKNDRPVGITDNVKAMYAKLTEKPTTVNEDDSRTKRLLSTTDAAEWAREFMKVFGDQREGGVIDEGTMIGWFANAIEVGRSAGQRPQDYQQPDMVVTIDADGTGRLDDPWSPGGSDNPYIQDYEAFLGLLEQMVDHMKTRYAVLEQKRLELDRSRGEHDRQKERWERAKAAENNQLEERWAGLDRARKDLAREQEHWAHAQQIALNSVVISPAEFFQVLDQIRKEQDHAAGPE